MIDLDIKIGENAIKLLPKSILESTSGILGILPSNAIWREKGVYLKSGKVLVDEQHKIATSGDLSDKSFFERIFLGNAFVYDSSLDDIQAYSLWLEVSGGIIHPVSIEAITYKNTMEEYGTTMVPAKSIIVKGMFRTEEFAPGTAYEEDQKYTKTTLSTIRMVKYRVVVEDGNGWSIDNMPDYTTVKNKLDTYPKKEYISMYSLLKYRL